MSLAEFIQHDVWWICRVVYNLSILNFIEIYAAINTHLQILSTTNDDNPDASPLFLLAGLRVDRHQLQVVVSGKIAQNIIISMHNVLHALFI